jgi:hypothetical protein
MVSLPLRLFGFHELLGHETLSLANAKAEDLVQPARTLNIAAPVGFNA